ncbi:hypothetical protein D7B24_004830 [Verticillium nonalfalfae]|uniref:DSBA-like thioredoxin domain-containing protein n=1 Tax=Verticillium nonalfalfae TaxID=1051616 RepID=A0A3M9YFM4_9PEZI|nr:uncharacterized protein D7B24_004830 [Verticillium nonalfalfae]RNJ58378.1 hypothetical protein D7B24_004830 [Verticillium nonalfalfae]
MVTIHIEVVSDTLCPWCYVAKANLDRAIALHRERDPDTVFHVVWKPFYLYPNLPPTSMAPSSAVLILPVLPVSAMSPPFSPRKHEPFSLTHTPDQPRAPLYPFAPDIQSRLTTAAQEARLTLSPASFTAGRAGNSRPAHQLLRHLARSQSSSPASTPSPRATSSSAPFPSVPGHGYAQPRGAMPAYSTPQSRFLDALFNAYFARCLDVSNREVLLELAVKAGLERAEAHDVLESEESRRGTDEEAARARGERGVEGVPTMTIQGQWRVGGMQGVELLLGVFEKAARGVAAGGAGGSGGRSHYEGATRQGSRGSDMWLSSILDA